MKNRIWSLLGFSLLMTALIGCQGETANNNGNTPADTGVSTDATNPTDTAQDPLRDAQLNNDSAIIDSAEADSSTVTDGSAATDASVTDTGPTPSATGRLFTGIRVNANLTFPGGAQLGNLPATPAPAASPSLSVEFSAQANYGYEYDPTGCPNPRPLGAPQWSWVGPRETLRGSYNGAYAPGEDRKLQAAFGVDVPVSTIALAPVNLSTVAWDDVPSAPTCRSADRLIRQGLNGVDSFVLTVTVPVNSVHSCAAYCTAWAESQCAGDEACQNTRRTSCTTRSCTSATRAFTARLAFGLNRTTGQLTPVDGGVPMNPVIEAPADGTQLDINATFELAPAPATP